MPADGASDLERAVLGSITRAGTITGDPVGVIARQLNQQGQFGRQRIIAELAKLRNDGKIDVRYKKGVIARVASIASPYVGWRPETSEGRRQATYAKGVPSRLRDDQCSPVEVTRMSPEEARRRVRGNAHQQMPELVYRDDAPYHQNLTVCLTALRQMVDERGVGEGLSVRKVLIELVGNMTGSKADRAMEHLRGMDLYTTIPVGFQTRDYTLDIDVSEVTSEMLERYRQSKKRASVQVPSARVDVPPEGESRAASESDDVLRLVEIIENLEAQLATSKGEVERLGREFAESQRQLTLAREELAHRPAVDPRVQDVLARYRR